MLSQFIKHQKGLKLLVSLALILGLLAACATAPKQSADGRMSASERLLRIKQTGTSKITPENPSDEQGAESSDSSSDDTNTEANEKSVAKGKNEENPEQFLDANGYEYKLPKAKKREHVLPEVSKEIKDAYKDALKSMEKGMKNKEFDEALEQFKAIQAQNNQFSGPSTNIGMIYMHQEKFEEAEAAFKKALEINNENERAHNNLGLTYRELGKFPEAKQSYQSAIELEPKYAEAHYNLGVLAELYLQDLELAIQSFEHYRLANRKGDPEVDNWLVDLRNRLTIQKQLAAQANAPSPAQTQTQSETQTTETNQELESSQENIETSEPAVEVDTNSASQQESETEIDSEVGESPVESESNDSSDIQDSE